MSRIFRVLIMAAALCVPVRAAAQSEVIRLFDGPAPGSESWTWSEKALPCHGHVCIRNVAAPTLTVFAPPADKRNGAAVIVAPGGGFTALAMDIEGEQTARRLVAHGVTVFILRYRIAHTTDDLTLDATPEVRQRARDVRPLAEADGRRALQLVRQRAAEWGVSPDRIGILGFSAGGDVALSTIWKHETDGAANFVGGIYPSYPDAPPPPKDAPPLFLAQASDDTEVDPAKTALPIYLDWLKAKVPVELHMYRRGGHAWRGGGMGSTSIDRFLEWMDDSGFSGSATGSAGTR